MITEFVLQWNNFLEKLYGTLNSHNLNYAFTGSLLSSLNKVKDLESGIRILPFPTIVLDKSNQKLLSNKQFERYKSQLDFYKTSLKVIESVYSIEEFPNEVIIETIDTSCVEHLNNYSVKTVFYPIVENGNNFLITIFLIDNYQIEIANFLHKTFEDLKIIIDNIPYIIYLKDTFNRVIRINSKFKEKFDIEKGLIEGQFVDRFFSPEVVSECKKKEDEIIKSKVPIVGSEERLALTSKNEIIVLVDRVPIINSFEEVVGILVFSYDLTEKKQHELELRRWKKRFDLIITATAQAVFERDWESEEVVWTENIEQILGYSPKELRKREKWLEKIHPEDLDAYSQKFKIHCDSLTPYTINYRVLNNSGAIRFVKETGFFLLEDNKIVSIIGIISDLTNQKNLEQKISDYNVFLHFLLDTIPMPIFYENIEGKIIGCNKAFQEQILTLPKKEFLGKTVDSFIQIFPKSFVEKHKKTNRDIIENKLDTIVPYDETLTLSDGITRSFAVYKSGYKDFDNNLAGIINILIDITEKIKAEEALRNINLELEKKIEERTKDLQIALEEYRFEVEEHRRVQEILEQANFELKILNDILAEESQKLLVLNEKLESSEKELREANSAKDKFFTIIAHDLKNPLQSILTDAEILERFFENFDKEKLRDYVHHIFKTSTLLKNMLENLLTWAKTQTHRITFRPEWVDLGLVLSDVVKHIAPNSSNKEIEIIYTSQAKAMAYIDRNLITIVVRNLLTNAIKFSKRGGRVWLRVEEVNDINIPSIKISIQDEGVGISPDRLDKLFKIEFSSITQGTEKEEGTGLGLIICKELIELHKGKIWVESEKNKGSTFSFIIPINFD